VQTVEEDANVVKSTDESQILHNRPAMIRKLRRQLRKIDVQSNEMSKAISSIEAMQCTSDMMRFLMLDLLDLAQMENQNLKINNEMFNLPKVILNSFEVVKHTANLKQVHLICPELSEHHRLLLGHVLGDPRRYTQILINFLSNALKFSHKNSQVMVNLRINEIVEKKDEAFE
jgi:two-component system, OmpR family, phosphate regulon sensor histidine kinase PhoR